MIFDFKKQKTRAILERISQADQWLFGTVLFEEKLVSRWYGFVLLARLEDQELIVGKADPVSGRRCYQITDLGRAWLQTLKETPT